VERYGILTDSYRSLKQTAPQEVISEEYEARMPSDHFPVVIRVRY
jgi:endonuclease/exonuclease/phosphatase family metal-dependent hydrolase